MRRTIMRTLYEITEELRALLDKAQEIDLDEKVIQNTIESMGLDKDLEQKVENYWYVIDELEASNKRIREEEERLQARRTTQENNIKRMKDTLTGALEFAGVEKIKTDKSTIWIQNNPIGLAIRDESKIPKRFYIDQDPKLNKRELIDYLKENPDEDFDGAELKQTRGIRRR